MYSPCDLVPIGLVYAFDLPTYLQVSPHPSVVGDDCNLCSAYREEPCYRVSLRSGGCLPSSGDRALLVSWVACAPKCTPSRSSASISHARAHIHTQLDRRIDVFSLWRALDVVKQLLGGPSFGADSMEIRRIGPFCADVGRCLLSTLENRPILVDVGQSCSMLARVARSRHRPSVGQNRPTSAKVGQTWL